MHIPVAFPWTHPGLWWRPSFEKVIPFFACLVTSWKDKEEPLFPGMCQQDWQLTRKKPGGWVDAAAENTRLTWWNQGKILATFQLRVLTGKQVLWNLSALHQNPISFFKNYVYFFAKVCQLKVASSIVQTSEVPGSSLEYVPAQD